MVRKEASAFGKGLRQALHLKEKFHHCNGQHQKSNVWEGCMEVHHKPLPLVVIRDLEALYSRVSAVL